jgi:hypothetical protein
MAKSKYGKYIVTRPKKDIVPPPWAPKGKIPGRLAYIDKEVVDGAFYMECVWMMPGSVPPADIPLRREGRELIPTIMTKSWAFSAAI